jgi:hypothetical protein
METDKLPPERVRKCGRPRVIPVKYEQLVVKLYERGYGYRAIASYLREQEHGLNPHFSSVRKLLIRVGKVKVKPR